MAALATRYKDKPGVLYSLQVEPHGQHSWDELLPRWVSMTDAIRAAHPKALVFVPGTQWARYVHWARAQPVPRPNVVYTTHPYDEWATIQPSYQLDAVKAVYPLLIGEFGTGTSMSHQTVLNLLAWTDTNKVSWAAWSFDDEATPVLLTERVNFTPTDPYGLEVRNRLRMGAP